MDFKKNLHLFNPKKKEQEKQVEVHQTKRKKKIWRSTPDDIERRVRELLSRQVSGSYIGLWLLIPEHLRLGSWDLLKPWSGGDDRALEPRLGMQMVHEAALCVNGVRPRNSLCHQGFELLNGLPYLATDKAIHELLDKHTIAEAQHLQIALGKVRYHRGHYPGELFAFDPHRVKTTSQRMMPAKKSSPSTSSRKVMQYFFCIDAQSGQPLAFTIGSSAKTANSASLELLQVMKAMYPGKGLVLADTEHFTAEITNAFYGDEQFDILMPIPLRKKVKEIMAGLTYHRQWAGYSIAETSYQLSKGKQPIRFIAQRSAEVQSEYEYKPFAATGKKDAIQMLSHDYPERWTIEEFYNFESAMGWNRAATMNLHIRYGKLSLALIAQAATYQLKQKLPEPYKNWTAEHLANSVFREIQGDLKVKKDTIIVTMYNIPSQWRATLKAYYENSPHKLKAEGINPKVPWLYDFKVDFRFK